MNLHTKQLARAAALVAAILLGPAPASAQVTAEGRSALPARTQPLSGPDTLAYGAGLPVEIRNPNLRENGWSEATSLVYSRLYRVGLDGKIAPDLVEKDKVGHGGLVWKLRLRDDVRWHDGRPFTSADVKATMDAVFDPNASCDLDLDLPMVESFEYPNERTVVIHLKTPYPQLAVPLSEIAMLPEPRAGAEASAAPPGTGPYMPHGPAVKGEMIFDRYESYHLGTPALKTIVLKEIPRDADRAKALVQGIVDLAPISARNLRELVGRPDLRVARMRSGAWRGMPLNLKQPFLRDVRVRRAIDLTLNREDIALFALPHGGSAAYEPLPPESWAFSEDLGRTYRNTDEAKRLLAEAGWMSGEDGKRRKDPSGAPLTLRILVWRDDAFRRAAAETIKDNLGYAGIGVEIVEADHDEYVRTAAEMDDKVDAYIGGWGALLDPGDNLYKKFHTGGSQNDMGFSDEGIDRLLEEAGRTEDREKAKAIYLEIMQKLREEAVLLPLVYPDYLFGMSSTVLDVPPAVVDSWYEFPRNAYLWRKTP